MREGDGTQSVWVTADRRRFTILTVKIGDQRDGYRQIFDGVKAGELAATEGAIFLSNELSSGVNEADGAMKRVTSDREATCA